MKVCIVLMAPVHVHVDIATGAILSVQVDDEGIEIGAGVNEIEDIEGTIEGTLENATPEQVQAAAGFAAEGDWPAWQIGVSDIDAGEPDDTEPREKGEHNVD